MSPQKHLYYVFITTDEYKKILGTAIMNISNERSYRLRFEDIASKALERNPECVYILCWEKYQNVFQAVSRECTIRKMSVKEKRETINKSNPGWAFLNDKVLNSIYKKSTYKRLNGK